MELKITTQKERTRHMTLKLKIIRAI